MRRGLLIVAGVALVWRISAAEDWNAVFDQRLKPIALAKDADSCAECHLAGVSIKDFLHDRADVTFLSLRDQGLADVAKPENSRILALIQMAKPNSSVMTAQARQREYDAMLRFLQACAADPALRDRPKLAPEELKRPAADNTVIRHEREDRLLERYRESIWAEVGRCAGCHSPANNAQQVARFGQRVSWVVPDDPAATLTRMVQRGYFDLDKPAESLVVMKPTGQVQHGGGPKMLVGDEGWVKWVGFIEDYAKSTRGAYRTAADLPPAATEETFASDVWIRLDRPDGAWKDKAVAYLIYAWDPAANDFERTPIASASRLGDATGMQQQLYLRATKGSARAQGFARARALPRGRYLVLVYFDPSYSPGNGGKAAQFGEAQRLGRIVVDRGWGAGYGGMNKLGPLPPG